MSRDFSVDITKKSIPTPTVIPRSQLPGQRTFVMQQHAQTRQWTTVVDRDRMKRLDAGVMRALNRQSVGHGERTTEQHTQAQTTELNQAHVLKTQGDSKDRGEELSKSSKAANRTIENFEPIQLTRLYQGAEGRIQRLTWVPFPGDETLEGFAKKELSSDAPPLVIGENQTPVGENEDIIIVAHGNGTQLYSHYDREKGGQNFSMAEFPTIVEMIRKILPTPYKGEITFWACNTAKPYGKIPELQQALKEDPSLETRSFIRDMKEELTDETVGVQPRLKGAIGYITTDKEKERAKVFLDPDNQILDKYLPASEGLIGTEQDPPDDFYVPLRDDTGEESQEENVGLEAFYNEDYGDEVENAQTTTSTPPRRRNKRQRERLIREQSESANQKEEPEKKKPRREDKDNVQ